MIYVYSLAIKIQDYRRPDKTIKNLDAWKDEIIVNVMIDPKELDRFDLLKHIVAKNHYTTVYSED